LSFVIWAYYLALPVFPEHLLYSLYGLFDTGFILHQCKPDKPLSVFTEAIPGETATFPSFNSNLENSTDPIFLNGFGISPHTNIVAFGFSISQRPSSPVAECISPSFVDLCGLMHALLVVVQGNNGGNLHGLEDPIIHIALQSGKGRQHVRISHREADTPSSML